MTGCGKRRWHDGAGHNRDGYKLAQFKKIMSSRKGTCAVKRKLMKTRRAFADLMEKRGKHKKWGDKEFDRRALGNAGWKVGIDSDKKLTTEQCLASSEEEEYEGEAMEDRVELETKRVLAR